VSFNPFCASKTFRDSVCRVEGIALANRNEGSNIPARPSWKHKRPAPRTVTPGNFDKSKLMKHDDVNWTRVVDPRERYRILYEDRDGQREERTIELQKIGDREGTPYLGVMHQGKFKTLRAGRIVDVLEQLTIGHEPSIHAAPSYATLLPKFPVTFRGPIRIPQTARPTSKWSVDLALYTCSCPEKRIRSGFGYAPGQLGFVCSHIARAILENLPATAGWPDELLTFLRDPRRVHIDNLS
jgi:hypothetical protein